MISTQSSYKLIAMILLAGAPATGVADADNTMDDDDEGFSFTDRAAAIRLGTYNINSLTKMRIDDSTGTIGTTITLEDDLNLDSEKSTFYIGADIRLVGRHYLELEHFSLKRSGLETLSTRLEIGDQDFEIGAIVDSFFDTEVYRVSYSYLVADRPTWFLAFSAGIHVTDLSTGIRDITPINNLNDNFAFADVTAPLPVLGVNTAWRFTEKLSLRARFQVFRLEISDYEGALDHAAIKLDWEAFKYVGFGIGYDLFSIDLDISRDRWNGRVDFRFDGPLLYVKGFF